MIRRLLYYLLAPVRLAYQSIFLAIGQIWTNKVRSILTTIGIIIGVASVTALPVSVHGSKAVIRGRVDLTAYLVVDSSGVQTARPAVTGQELDFSLVRTPEGWRIESISEPAST